MSEIQIGVYELFIVGIICLCLVVVIAASFGGIVLLVRRSQKNG